MKDDIEISGSGKLTVTSAAVYDETLDLGSYGISGDGNLTVKNGVTVIATGGDNPGHGISQGINVIDLTVEEGASVTATGGKATGDGGMSNGIRVDRVITVAGIVNATGGNADISSMGVQTKDAVVTGKLEALAAQPRETRKGRKYRLNWPASASAAVFLRPRISPLTAVTL